MAGIIRRALDTYLAWDDPMYTPCSCPKKGTAIHPLDESQGFLARSL